MRTPRRSIVLAGLLALLVVGCETDGGIAARAREKSAAYSALKPWEKRFVDQGVVSLGFNADMVYMAAGRPTSVQNVTLADGTPGELWTYGRYYPPVKAGQMRYAPYTTESHYQMAQTTSVGGRQVPIGHDGNRGLSMGPGPPQGGSGEPADLQSYTLRVLFLEGKVTKVGADPNYN